MGACGAAFRLLEAALAGELVAHVAGEALATVLAGTLAGLALGSAAAPSLTALLFQTGPLDPRTLALPALALLLTACAAALIPVVRALRLPAAALLRGE